MQCPPRPGPGRNFMKPNGLVAAASITSQTSTPSLSQTIAISLTRPMLTLRKVFSSSFTSSAASVVVTGTSVSIAGWYMAQATLRQSAVMPPTTLGVFLVPYLGLPGSTRSGEKARKKSSPTLSPVLSSAGSMISRVVPGYVVLSRMITCPLRSVDLIASVAATMNDTSGSLYLDSGVG